MHSPRSIHRSAILVLSVAMFGGSVFAAPVAGESSAGAVADVATFETVTLERTNPGCKPAQGDDLPACAEVKVVYPKVTTAPNGMADHLNGYIMEQILSVFSGGDEEAEPPSTLDEGIKEFFSLYEETKKDFPEMPAAWSREIEVEVIYNTPRVVSLAFHTYEYTGGAHPNGISILKTIDLKTGAPVAIGDLFAPGYEAKLDALVEREIRKVREIPKGQSLEEAGFFLAEDGKLHANDNFALNDTGITFYYNSYEIGPYALGPTEILIPYADARALMKKEATTIVGQ